jgi:hypothetical protein
VQGSHKIERRGPAVELAPDIGREVPEVRQLECEGVSGLEGCGVRPERLEHAVDGEPVLVAVLLARPQLRCVPASTRAETTPPRTVTSVSGLAPRIPSTAKVQVSVYSSASARTRRRRSASAGTVPTTSRATTIFCASPEAMISRARLTAASWVCGSIAPGPSDADHEGPRAIGAGSAMSSGRSMSRIRVIHARSPRRPITVVGMMSVEGAAEASSKASAAKATRPVPGRSTSSYTSAVWLKARHRSAMAAIRPSSPTSMCSRSGPAATRMSPLRVQTSGFAGSANSRASTGLISRVVATRRGNVSGSVTVTILWMGTVIPPVRRSAN